jgi:hypothetical protein
VRGSHFLWPVLVIPTALVLAIAVPVLSRYNSSQAASRATTSDRKDASALVRLPRPAKPAFVPGKPRFLRTSQNLARWAVVRTAVAARVTPSPGSQTIARLLTETPEGTSNIVLVLGNRVDDAGALWIRVRLPVLGKPNTGWIPRAALGGYATVTTHLVVDLDSLQATLFRDGRAIFRADVGVGMSSWPTPRGEFYIRNKLTGYASTMYGPLAFGTSARSRVLTDWPAGGFVGIHGTNRPDQLPGRVSHGCIRMRNEDILRLSKLMPVGTPLTIR